ncbi:MAG: M15 family metallopeptidase, partial [Cyanobacteria bacterium P01_A01_bin.40]
MEEMEIPEAIRESAELPKESRLASTLPLALGIIICLSAMGLLSFWLFLAKKQPALNTVSTPASKSAATKPQDKPQPPQSILSESAKEEEAVVSPKQIDLLGHLPYSEAPASELSPIAGNLKLRSPAAVKFQQMQAAAKAEGINLVAISAFRDADTQEHLFFGIKEQRGQDAAKRAEVSAPPGYSEHHTGYAVDIGDGNAPATHLETDFANTAAFRWLEQNALKYSFELS